MPLPSIIKTDPTRLKQILINLCSNAVKFTKKGEVVININFNINSNSLYFKIIDHGIGIPKNKIHKIFMPFLQADETTSRKYGGTGLGLTISKDLAEKMGGSLTCSSNVNHGSLFKLVLPIGDFKSPQMIQSMNEIDNFQSRLKHDEIHRLNGHILLAEDIADNQLLITLYVEKTGAEITVVENGKDAVEEALNNNYDLVIMDMQMPIMDGISAVKALRKAAYKKPITMLTANATHDVQAECYKAGANEFLTKPIEKNKFYAVLNKYLLEDKSEAVENNQLELMNDPKYKKIKKLFVDHLPDELEKIAIAIENSDWNTIENRSHSLKGMGGSFGYNKITKKAEALNLISKKRDYEKTSHAYRELKQYCKSIYN